jgi:hypothetical protein
VLVAALLTGSATAHGACPDGRACLAEGKRLEDGHSGDLTGSVRA